MCVSSPRAASREVGSLGYYNYQRELHYKQFTLICDKCFGGCSTELPQPSPSFPDTCETRYDGSVDHNYYWRRTCTMVSVYLRNLHKNVNRASAHDH